MTEAAGKIRSLRQLGFRQWQVLLSAPGVLLLTAVRLRRRGLRATLASAQTGRVRVRPPPDPLALAQETAHALAIAVKYGPWWPRCLLRSLTLGWFLGRRGVSYDLRIGLPAGSAGVGDERRPPGLRAHAWIEVDGTVVNDREEVADNYVPFVGTK